MRQAEAQRKREVNERLAQMEKDKELNEKLKVLREGYEK